MKVFVYGIFLSESARQNYGMSNPQYAVVLDYVTIQLYSDIVGALHVTPDEQQEHLALTGLLCDLDTEYLDRLDALEGAYDRVQVTTVAGDTASMYIVKEAIR